MSRPWKTKVKHTEDKEREKIFRRPKKSEILKLDCLVRTDEERQLVRSQTKFR